MAILTEKCPHCLTEHIGMSVVSTTAIASYYWAMHLKCPKCRLPAAATVIPVPGAGSVDPSSLLKGTADVLDHGWMVEEFWPSPPEPLIPEYLPPDITRVYLQAERNFSIDGNEEAAGMMYRKALDVGLKKIDPTQSGMLGPRLKKLAAEGKLTADIVDWANNIRDIGNDAAHEEQPISRDELSTLRNLTEMVMRYLFTLPNMIKRRRGMKLDWEADDDGGSPA